MSENSPLSELAQTTVLLDNIEEAIVGGWKTEYVWQLAAFVVAIAVAWFLSRRFNAWAFCHSPSKSDESWHSRIRRYLIDISSHLSFSLIAASTLWLLVWLIEHAGLVSSHSSLVFAQLGYLVFYGFALLRLLLYALRGMLGEKLVTPALTKVITWVFWILVALEFAGVLPAVIHFMETQSIPIGKENLTLWTAFSGLVSVLLTLGVANWLANLIDEAFRRSATMAPNLKVVLGRICRWVLMVAAVLIAMSSVGIDLTVLSVFGGALGVGVGFGLQKIASNYISGFIILLDRSVKIGDFVEIGGFKGKITEINTRYTVVNDWNGVDNIVPNETFVTSSVKNYYHTDNASVAVIKVSVAYGSDLNKALDILREEANKPDRVIKTKRGWTGITNLGDSAVNLEAGVWVSNIGDGTVGLRTQILINVLKRYSEEGIEVPFPQVDLHVRDGAGKYMSAETLAAVLASIQESEAKPAAQS
ncbi:mechanosensitive ion channel [Mesosutterella sp. AGMB02718]|uniref:Mechanosensitive ion channel n=1 Tax=Mesosutterella faecium TaxID=2925194 RepID=A0ABT7IJY1_9BURK|nr:mechanosensitive ion channel domain-containing protein [Mesosutterella sp. AGMB02718]MDL2058679.1 mechanosensitive ion channel [Mesosutterella sp. AGMB02718]